MREGEDYRTPQATDVCNDSFLVDRLESASNFSDLRQIFETIHESLATIEESLPRQHGDRIVFLPPGSISAYIRATPCKKPLSFLIQSMYKASREYSPISTSLGMSVYFSLLACSLLYITSIAATVIRYPNEIDNQAQPLKQPLLNISRLAGEPAFAAVYNSSSSDALAVRCDPPRFAPEISASSCMNAIEKIGRDFTERQYGLRFLGRFDNFLPYRALSCR